MSKLNLKLSYKNACILKHALRDKIKINQSVMDSVNEAIKGLDESQYTVEKYKKQKKELEEEKRALSAITEEINLEMHRHNS